MKLNKVNELGRSMVEMLGVLAIIGVLSVMGIAGYTIAMSSHHANEVLNQVNRVAMLISAERQLHGGVGSPTSDDNPYAVSLDTGNTNKIVLTATNVPAGALEKLKNMNPSVPKIAVSDTTVTFTFENDLGDGSSSETPTIPDCDSRQGWDGEKCVDVSDLYTHGTEMGTQYYFTENGANCPPNYHWASSSEVISDFDCVGNENGYYDCTYTIPINGAYLSDCVSTEDYITSIPCDDSSTYAFNATGEKLDSILRNDSVTDALCRHD